MAGRTASQAITRYAGIQVQTSALGTQIPVGWGTFRCRCNLVDYFNFQSKAQKAQAGKGGQTTTGFSYSASLVLAICEGPIDSPGGVTQVWVNGKQYAYGSNGSGVPNTQNTAALAQVGLSLAPGSVPQTPWAGLPASHQIGYSGLAIVHAANYPLDSSASTPNHSFEVVRQTGFAVGGGYSGPDVDPSLVIFDFFTNTRTGVPSWPAGVLDMASLAGAPNSFQKYALAAGLLLSPLIDQQRSATDFLNEVFLATNSTCVWSEGLLKFIPYGDAGLTANGQTYAPNNTPVYSLGDDDYIVKDTSDPPISLAIKDQSDAYNVVQIEYLDRTNQYNMAIALASDAANVAQYGMRRKDPDTAHVICTPAVAALAAQLWLQRTLYIRAEYRFKLSWAFALLEPGDLLEVTDAGLGLAAYTVRITGIDEDEKDGTLDVTCEDYPIGVHNAPLYTMQVSAPTVVNQAVDPGGVEANLLLWSGNFGSGVWGETALAVTPAAAPDPVTSAAITAGSASGTTCTVSVGSTAEFAAGGPLVVAGCTPAAYNGSFTVTSLTSTTLTYTAGSAPGGAMTGFGVAALANAATKLTPSVVNSLHQVNQATSGQTTFADANYTASVYLKQDGYSQAELILADPDGNAIFVSVDLTTGNILASGTAQVAGGAIATEGGVDLTTEGGAILEQDP